MSAHQNLDFEMLTQAPLHALCSPVALLAPQETGSVWTLPLGDPGCHCTETMELWRQLNQAGLVPPGLGLPPQALREPPAVGRAGQTLTSPGADTAGAREGLLWLWEELVSEVRGLEMQEMGHRWGQGAILGD